MLLVKEIYEWCLVAEDIILLALKIIYIYDFRKYIYGKGGLGGFTTFENIK